MQRQRRSPHHGGQGAVTGHADAGGGHAGAGGVGGYGGQGALQEFGVVVAGFAADHDGAGVEGGPEVLQQHAQVVAGAAQVYRLAVLAAEGAQADEGFGAAPAAAGAQGAVDLHDGVADFPGHALGAAEQPVVGDDACAHARVAAHKHQRVFALAFGKLVLAQSARVGIVLQLQRHRGQADLGKGLGEVAEQVQVAPAQVGGKQHQAAGVVDRARRAYAHAYQLQAHGHQLGIGGGHHAGGLPAGLRGVGAVQRLLFGMQNFALQADAGHAHHLDGDFHPDQRAFALVDTQRRGRAAQAFVDGFYGFGEPAVFQQLAHQQADRGFGQAALGCQPRPRQAGPGAQQTQQHAAVDALDELLVAGGFHKGLPGGGKR